MLEFKIQINNGVLTTINTPIDFDKTDFNLTRSKDYHSITSSFAGNKASFVFQKDIHNNIFDDLINEYETKGFNADVNLFIYWNNTPIFDGKFDFVESETDLVNTIKCQVVKKDKLFYLEKNKSIDVNVFNTKDLDNNFADAVNTDFLRIDSTALYKVSRWEDNNNTYFMSDYENNSFNNIRTQTIDEIPDSLNWLQVLRNWDVRGRDHQLISAKENLTDVNIKINISNDSTITLNNPESSKISNLYLCYGNENPDLSNSDWFASVNKTIIKSVTNTLVNPIQSAYVDYEITIPSLSRGSGVWLFWETQGTSFPSTANTLIFTNKESSVEISAYTKTYPSALSAVKYIDLIKNVVKKTAGISNVSFNIDWYNNTYSFNSNLLRGAFSQEMTVKWEDIKKQLNERNLGCYYEENTDTLIIDHRSSILGYNKIQDFGDLAKQGNYNVSEDNNYVINNFEFKYNKYQALKENAVEGNNATIHGESEWFINNKGYEGKISVELPFIRDSFMIEDLRRQSLVYREDTSTSDSGDIILIETRPITSSTTMRESFYVKCSFQDGQQTLINDGSFSFRRVIGGGEISLNNSSFGYFIISFTDTTLILGKDTSITQELNGLQNVNIAWRFGNGIRSYIQNGLLNTEFSIRQNIEYWKQTLQATNYYNQIPIINTLYKENKNEVINDLLETQQIITKGGVITPRYIENKVIISVSDYFNLTTNKIGYVSIYNSKNELIDIYIDEVNATFIDGCERMEATFKGWLKTDFDNYNTLIVTKNNINQMIISGLNFVFDDVNQVVSFKDRFGNVIYKDVIPTKICSDSMCFSTYSGAKNYLLSL